MTVTSEDSDSPPEGATDPPTELDGKEDASTNAPTVSALDLTLMDAWPVSATLSFSVHLPDVKHQNLTDSGQSGASSSNTGWFFERIESIFFLHGAKKAIGEKKKTPYLFSG